MPSLENWDDMDNVHSHVHVHVCHTLNHVSTIIIIIIIIIIVIIVIVIIIIIIICICLYCFFRDKELKSLSLPVGSSFNIELIDGNITAQVLSNIALLAGISYSDKPTLQQSISTILFTVIYCINTCALCPVECLSFFSDSLTDSMKFLMDKIIVVEIFVR